MAHLEPGSRAGDKSAPGPRCRIGDGATVGLGVYCQRPDRARRAGAAEERRRQTANKRGTRRLSATASSAHMRKIGAWSYRTLSASRDPIASA